MEKRERNSLIELYEVHSTAKLEEIRSVVDQILVARRAVCEVLGCYHGNGHDGEEDTSFLDSSASSPSTVI